MKESQLVSIAIIGAVIGLSLLFILSFRTKNFDISISRLETGSDYVVTGVLSEVQPSEGFTRMVLTYDATMLVVLYDKVEAEPGDVVEISGSYDGDVLTADMIKVLSGE